MKMFGLLRHAKSDWSDGSLDDFDRPLNKRGRATAEAMGPVIRGCNFDRVLASSAKRVRETVELAGLKDVEFREDMDARTGGGYRLEFGADEENTHSFFGRYLEVLPNARLVWTNEEDANGSVTTVTFEDDGGGTLLTFHELYPTKEVLDEAIEGMPDIMFTYSAS